LEGSPPQRLLLRESQCLGFSPGVIIIVIIIIIIIIIVTIMKE